MASNRETWMDQEAGRMNIPEAGRNWSILFDEMSIQHKVELRFTVPN